MYRFLEQQTSKNSKGTKVLRFVVVSKSEPEEFVSESIPHEIVRAHLAKTKTDGLVANYYLNGMSLTAHRPWVHTELSKDKAEGWVRSLSGDEFKYDYVVVEKHPFRTWHDQSGKFSVSARYLAFANGVVKLRRESGTRIEIELERLSSTDQEYVAKIRGKKK